MIKFSNTSLTKILSIGVTVKCSISVEGLSYEEPDWIAARELDPDILVVSDSIEVPVDFIPIAIVAKDGEDITPRLYKLLRRDNNLISVFTSTYNIGMGILKTYASLESQVYTDWEWVVVDDSTNEETYNILKKLRSKDRRIKLYRFNEQTNGNIGEAKYRASMLCSGNWSVELDHDDMLLPDALEILSKSIKLNPSITFFYSDWIEYDIDNDKYLEYDGGRFGFDYGENYKVNDGSEEVIACKACPINPTTIRHIISMPNHFRAWFTPTLRVLGYNRNIRIADDYELMIRTFLMGKFGYIPKALYIQTIHKNSATDKNRHDIQNKVALIHDAYRDQISNRLSEYTADPFEGMTHKEFMKNPTLQLFDINCAKEINLNS